MSSEDREDGWHLHLLASPLRDGFGPFSHFLLVAALVFASDTMRTNLGVGCRKLMSDPDSLVPFPPSQGFVLSCFLLVASLVFARDAMIANLATHSGQLMNDPLVVIL